MVDPLDMAGERVPDGIGLADERAHRGGDLRDHYLDFCWAAA
jgi:hypothetical protein